jgi:hypothetical protein
MFSPDKRHFESEIAKVSVTLEASVAPCSSLEVLAGATRRLTGCQCVAPVTYATS